MANTNRVDKMLFRKEHYLGKPADDTDKIISRRIEILKQYPVFFDEDLSMIEVGCGSGSTITQIAKHFKTCLGVDIYNYEREFNEQKEKHHAYNCNFRQINLEEESLNEQFDRLVSFEVIEHFKNEDSVSKFHGLLKPGGLVAITVPNKWWIFETHGARLPLLPWNRIPFFSWLPRFIHERFANARIYTNQRIKALLLKHQFEIIDWCYVTAPMDVLKEGALKRFLTKNIFKRNTTSIPFLSTSVFVLATKK